MNELVNNPLLQTSAINKVINDVELDPAAYRGQEILPFSTTDEEKIVIDIKKLLGGMTQAVASGAESPIVTPRGIMQKTFWPAHFREKQLLSPRDLNRIRKLGTTSDVDKAQEVIADVSKSLRERVETRIEWTRWQAIQGSLSYDENSVSVSVDYKFPSANTPTLTGTDLWSATTTATPVNDIMDWIFLFRGTGVQFKKMWFNAQVEKYLFQNSSIATLVNQVLAGGNSSLMTRKVLTNLFDTYIGNVPFEVYDKGYYVATEIGSAVTAVDTAITVNSINGFASGDSVTLTTYDGQTSETATIESVSGTTIELLAGTTNAFTVGSEIRAWKPFIPNNVVIMEGELPPGARGGNKIGEFISTGTEYGTGSLTNLVPGIFGETQIHENDDPKYCAVIGGVSGLPILYRENGFIVATVA